MSDNWQPGDLALCVNDGPFRIDGRPCFGPSHIIHRGGVYTVKSVGSVHGRVGLLLAEVDVSHWFEAGMAGAWRFRKIKPLSDEERDEFTADLNAPVREPVA